MWYLGALDLLKNSEKSIPKPSDNFITTVLADAFILLGAISLFMIVIAGLRYILARGNAETISQAKNMIQYSVTGLIIAALAEAIVQFVLGRAG